MILKPIFSVPYEKSTLTDPLFIFLWYKIQCYWILLSERLAGLTLFGETKDLYSIIAQVPSLYHYSSKT